MSAYSWEAGPFKMIATPGGQDGIEKDDPFVKWATDMALIHNAWMRALNGLYVAAPAVPPAEFDNFVGYAQRVHTCIHKHHTEEEEFVFPIIENMCNVQGLMSMNVQQHEKFETDFHIWGSYLSGLIDSKATADFSPDKFCTQIDTFREALQVHLEDEIGTLLSLADYENIDMDVLGKQIHNAVMARMTISELRDNLPVLMLNHDSTYENAIHGAFPALPLPLSFAIRRLATFWSAGFWKYTTCTALQLPRELPLARVKVAL